MLNPTLIQTAGDYEAALEETQRLWGQPVGTTEGDRLDILLSLIEAYERRHFPMPIRHNSEPDEKLQYRHLISEDNIEIIIHG